MAAFYHEYLSGLCDRRSWPHPHYGTYSSASGYGCVVTVNNREYQTDRHFSTEALARENAAMRAYLICRNFSVNDGMYPVGHDHGGIVQGIPTAIGAGRHHHRSKASSGHRSSVSSKSHYSSVSDSSSSPEGSAASPARYSTSRHSGYGQASQQNRGYATSNSTYSSSSYYRSMYPSGGR